MNLSQNAPVSLAFSAIIFRNNLKAHSFQSVSLKFSVWTADSEIHVQLIKNQMKLNLVLLLMF